MFGIIRARRGRKAAVALITPFVEASRRRFPGLSEEAWLNPYVVGFLAMLISLAAERATGGLDSQSAGLVQLGAWREVTGCNNDLIGEEICLLSTANDGLFGQGCNNARRFMSAITRAESNDDPDVPRGYSVHGMDYDLTTAMALWSEYFDAYITAPTSLPDSWGNLSP